MESTEFRRRSSDAASGRDDDVTVVVADEADLAAIVALDARISGIARPEFWQHFDFQRLKSGTLCVLAAKKAGKVVGYAMGEVREWPVRGPPCGWVYAIGVEKDYRLQGAATMLMDRLVVHFRDNGVGAIRTMVNIDDHLLISFLRSLGMTAGPFVELEMSIEQ